MFAAAGASAFGVPMILALDQLAAATDEECLSGDALLLLDLPLDDFDDALALAAGAPALALELAPG